MYRKSLHELRYENRMVHGLATRIPTRYLDPDGYSITADEILAGIREEGKEFYRDEIEGLLEEYRDLLTPVGMWQYVNFSSVSEDNIRMEKVEFPDPYLAARLKDVEYGDIFYVKIQDGLFSAFKKITDHLDHYLMGHILSTTLNKVFEQTVLEIAAGFPKGSILAMDNPGLSNGWKLSQQKSLIEILFGKPFSRCHEVRLDQHGFFENSYSLTGIIYSTNGRELAAGKNGSTEAPNLSGIKYLNAQELVTMLYQSAGII